MHGLRAALAVARIAPRSAPLPEPRARRRRGCFKLTTGTGSWNHRQRHHLVTQREQNLLAAPTIARGSYKPPAGRAREIASRPTCPAGRSYRRVTRPGRQNASSTRLMPRGSVEGDQPRLLQHGGRQIGQRDDVRPALLERHHRLERRQRRPSHFGSSRYIAPVCGSTTSMPINPPNRMLPMYQPLIVPVSVSSRVS